MARTPYYPNDPYSNQIPHLPIDAQTPQIYVIPHSGIIRAMRTATKITI